MPVTTFEEYRADLTDPQIERYRASQGRSVYRRDSGLLVIPVMGPPGTAPIVARVHAPYGTRTETFQSAKSGMPPVFPAPADTTSGDTLLVADLEFPLPTFDQDGKPVYGVQGEYTYVQPDGGRGPEDQFPINRHPFPTMLDYLTMLPRPKNNPVYDRVFMWNTDSVDVQLLGSYSLIG